MKKKTQQRRSLRGRVRPVTEERILQVCNDIAEDMNMRTHTKRELWECVRYLSKEHSKLNSNRVIQLMAIAGEALKSANDQSYAPPPAHWVQAGPNVSL